MCETHPRETSGKIAANTIAELVQKDLNVTVDPAALRLFILARWGKLSLMAHVIHREMGG